MSLSLIVKGTRAQAISACIARGIGPLLSIEEGKLYAEVYIRVPRTQLTKVTRWFIEPCGDRSPFPTGTLLFFNEVPHVVEA